MASGVFNLTTDDSFLFQLLWNSTLNKSANTTTLTFTLQGSRPAGYSNNASSYTGELSLWDGEQIGETWRFTSGSKILSSGSWTFIASTSFTISHNSNGVAPSMFVDCLGYGTPNGTGFATARDAVVELPANDRYAYITSAPHFTDEENPTIKYYNSSGNQVSSLQACIASDNGASTYVNYRDISKTGQSYTFELTDAERETLREVAANSNTLNVRFYIRTVLNGSTYHSYSSTRIMTIVNAEPILEATIKDTHPVATTLTGSPQTKIVKGQNLISVIGEAQPQKGATIERYEIVCGNEKKTSNSTTFTNIETDTISITAYDSRGNKATKTHKFEVVDYFKPTCNYKVSMDLATGGASADAHLEMRGNYFNGSFGAVNNTLEVFTRTAENDGEWNEWGEITILVNDISDGMYYLTATLSGFNPSSAYTFQYKVVDKLNAIETETYTIQLLPIFDWSNEDFNFNVPVSFNGQTMNDFVIETGTEAMGSNGTWYWSKWASGRAECYGCRNYGNMGVSTAWGGLYRSEAFSQSLPFGLFAKTPEVIDITFRNSNFGAWIAKHETSAPSTDESGSFIVVRPASATLSQAYIGFNVIGRWK